MVILITGSTDGIGKAAALELTKLNHKVIIHGRNKEKCKDTEKFIEKETGKQPAGYVYGDLSEITEIHNIAKQVKDKFSDINVLVNNAGVFMGSRVLNKDKIEYTFMINYLAVYLLTGLLLDILAKNSPSRIINVASMAHSSSLDFNNLQGENGYDGYTAYGYSKLADIMFTFALHDKLKNSEKYKDITVNCLHPGVISTKLLHSGWGIGGASVKSGAERIVYMTGDEVKDISGKYFFDMRISEPAEFAYNKEAQYKLMAISEKLTNFKY